MFLSRLLLNIHELITIKEAMMCGKQGHHPFSVWSMVTISISHFLLVLNSATNILVYCLLSSKFREECSKILIRRKPLHTPQQRLLYVNKCCCFWKPKDRNSTSRIAENGNNLLEQSSKSKAQAIQFFCFCLFFWLVPCKLKILSIYTFLFWRAEKNDRNM